MPQKEAKSQCSGENDRFFAKNLHEEIHSLIKEVIVIRSGKTTSQHSLPKNQKTVKPTMKEGKKSISPLRSMKRNRNFQSAKQKKFTNKTTESVLPQRNHKLISPGGGRKTSKKMEDNGEENGEAKTQHTKRKGILKSNKQNISVETPKNKTETMKKNGNFKYQETTKVVKKKVVKFETQSEFRGRLTNFEGETEGTGKMKKYSTFLEETHKNIADMTEYGISGEESDGKPGNSCKKVVEKNQSEPTMAQQDVPEALKTSLDLISENPSCSSLFWAMCSMNYQDVINETNLGEENTLFSEEDIIQLLNEDDGAIQRMLNDYINLNLDENEAKQMTDEESKTSLECCSFISNNVLFPVIAFGCISLCCALLLKHHYM